MPHLIRLVLLCLLIISCGAHGEFVLPSPIQLDHQSAPIDPSEHALWWVDSNKSPVADIRLPDPNVASAEFPSNADFGLYDGYTYVYFEITEHAAQEHNWLLSIPYPPLDSIELFTSTDRITWDVQQAGDTRSAADREVQHPHHSFRLPSVGSDSLSVVLRVASTTRLYIPLELWPERSWYQQHGFSTLIHGLYYGALLSLALYNAFLYPTVRQPSYIYYGLYLMTMLGFQFSMDGNAALYLWPTEPWLADRAPTIFASLCLFCGLAFARLMSLAEIYCPLHNKLIKWFQPITLLPLLIVVLGGTPGAAFGLLISIAAVSTVLIVNTVVLSMMAGYRLSMYLLIAFSALVPGIVLLLLANFGVISTPAWIGYILQIGTFVEAILLSMTLAYRFNELQDERNKSNEKNLLLERQMSTTRSEFSQRLLATQDQERKRISVDLHDGISQNLAAISNQVSALNADEPAKSTQLRSYIADTIQNVRTITYDLHPHMLDQLGLETAMQETMEKAFAPLAVEYSLETVENMDAITQKCQLHLYRIVQELVHNAVKHSAARNVGISFKRHEQILYLSYADDGVGYSQSSNKRGLGMDSIKERVRAMHGQFAMQTDQQRGFHLTIALPWAQLHAKQCTDSG